MQGTVSRLESCSLYHAGLDKLAQQKREESSHTGLPHLGKRSRLSLEEDTADDHDASAGAAAGAAVVATTTQQRHYRGQRLDTPSHAGTLLGWHLLNFFTHSNMQTYPILACTANKEQSSGLIASSGPSCGAGGVNAAAQKAIADRKQKDSRAKEGVYASSRDRSSNGHRSRDDRDRERDRHVDRDKHDKHRSSRSSRHDSTRHSRESENVSWDKDRSRSKSRHRNSSWEGSNTPQVQRSEDEWEMTPSQSGRATPTPHRLETGRSQWDYTASPAPSPARAGTGTGDCLPHKAETSFGSTKQCILFSCCVKWLGVLHPAQPKQTWSFI